ncbi:MAG: MBL fold metallo-hydrolase [Alphaproteobacteria bacterium]|nr:MBL fold metallo-hydrolase [Alphaproteobacteria bacterium]
MSLELTILGCGSSAGVPRVGGDWGACDPAEPRNRRRRCSLLASRTGLAGTTRLLIDTSPDLREQMLSADVPSLDAVWFTHDHADHTHGLDDLRAFFLLQKKRLPLFADAQTARTLETRFAYCFVASKGYPAIADLNEITPYEALESEGAGGIISGLPIPVQHGNIEALCFRFGNAAYMPDVNAVPARAMDALRGLDTLIIDALRYSRHPSHFCLSETLAVIADLKPRRAIITNMHIDLDFATLQHELPPGVEPAYDGMTIRL